MTSYAILGGNGVFGVHAAQYLLSQPETDKVICIGRNPHQSEAFSLGLSKALEEDSRYRYYQVHVVFEPERLLEVLDCEFPDVIINIAAQGEGAVSWQNSWRYFETNATALARIVESLKDRKYLKRWIQIGTSELYGSVSSAVSETAPIIPTSPYAASKAAADIYLQALHKTQGFPANIIRPSNAYGPGQRLHRIIPKAVVCGLSGTKVPLQGGGTAKKSYIHATDLARAIHLVAQEAPFGTIYNVGPKHPVSIRQVVQTVADALEMSFEELVRETPGRFGEDSMYWLDSSEIEKLGWKQQIGLREGIDDVVQWGRKHLKVLKKTPQNYVFHA